MDRRYHLSHAMEIASRPAALAQQCRAISVLQSHLMDLHFKDATMTDGYTREEIAASLSNLLLGQRYSDDLYDTVNDARKRILDYFRMSPTFLSDVKNWAILNDEEREKRCQMVVREISHVFRDIEHVPPSIVPAAAVIYNDKEVAYVDDAGACHSYIPTVTTAPAERDYGSCILINKNPKTNYDDPYMTLAGVYGAFLSLVEEGLERVSRTNFVSSYEKFNDDISLWHATRSEGAFVDSYLDSVKSKQFNIALLDEQRSLFHDELKDIMEKEWDSIPEREVTPSKKRIGGLLNSILNMDFSIR